jgi:hypothetical protein
METPDVTEALRSAQAAEFFRMPTQGVMVLATDIEL